MKLIIQTDYDDIEYVTDANNPQSDFYLNGTIAKAGCGICCASMLIERLSLESFDLIDARDMAIECKANLEPGTDMALYSAALSERFNLKYSFSDSIEDLIDLLKKGGAAIANTGGDREAYKSIFYDIGHYVVILAYRNGYFQVLDPAYSPDKFRDVPNKDEVIDNNGILYISSDVLLRETDNRSPRFYLFIPSLTIPA